MIADIVGLLIMITVLWLGYRLVKYLWDPNE